MDLDHLKYFVSVAQTLNFSEAARLNGVQQPKISRSILELETELGAQLFSRTKRDVFLTREGSTFLPYATDVVATLQKAAFNVEQIHSGRTGYLSIATVFNDRIHSDRLPFYFCAKIPGNPGRYYAEYRQRAGAGHAWKPV